MEARSGRWEGAGGKERTPWCTDHTWKNGFTFLSALASYPFDIGLGGIFQKGGIDKEGKRGGCQCVSFWHLMSAPATKDFVFLLPGSAGEIFNLPNQWETRILADQVSISLATVRAALVSSEESSEER